MKQIGMTKMTAKTAERALRANMPNPWLKAYAEDVPGLINRIEELEKAAGASTSSQAAINA